VQILKTNLWPPLDEQRMYVVSAFTAVQMS